MITPRPVTARTLGVAIAIVLPAALATGQQPTFSARVDAVRVDALVTEGGRPVKNLSAADFEVFDNGVRQQVTLATFERIPLNVVLALDMSDSVAGERLMHLRSAGKGLLDGLRGDDRVALVTFGSRVTLGTELTGEMTRVRAAIDAIDPKGSTRLVDGCFAGMMLGEWDVGRALVIVFSDGLDTTSWLSASAVLDTARHMDIVVYSVSADRSRNAPFLRDLSKATGGALLEIESTEKLSAVLLQIVQEFRERYLISYYPRGVERRGWHRLEVRVKGRDVTVKARPGYFGGDVGPGR
jgi:VWFA-related protein